MIKLDLGREHQIVGYMEFSDRHIVCCETDNPHTPWTTYLVAKTINPNGHYSCFLGHYYVTRMAAMVDFIDRCQQHIRSH